MLLPAPHMLIANRLALPCALPQTQRVGDLAKALVARSKIGGILGR